MHYRLLLHLVPLFAFGGSIASPQTKPPPLAPVERPLRVVELAGSPFERGVTHGKTLKKEIHELVKLWRQDLEQSYGMPSDQFIVKFLEQTTFEDAIEQWTPDLLEEIRGIAEGAGLPRDVIYAFQLVDEVWANARELTGKHCTSIGVNRQGDRPTYVAQNLDIPDYYHGYQTVLHVKGPDTAHEEFVLTIPGLVGANGINNHAIAITCNTLLDLSHSTAGLPVACVVRGVLARKELSDVVDFLQKVPHASGQNYIVGGHEGALSLECSSHKVTEFVPWKDAALTFHTNHACANDDYSAAGLARARPIQCARFAAVEARLKNRDAPIDLDVLKDALSSRDAPRNPVSNAGTYACTIMELSDPPVLHIAPGRPHETAFKILRFTPAPAKSAAPSK